MLIFDKYYNYLSTLKELCTLIFKLASHGPKCLYRISFLTFMIHSQEVELPKVYFKVLSHKGYLIEQKTDLQICGSAVFIISSHTGKTTGYKALY